MQSLTDTEKIRDTAELREFKKAFDSLDERGKIEIIADFLQIDPDELIALFGLQSARQSKNTSTTVDLRQLSIDADNSLPTLSDTASRPVNANNTCEIASVNDAAAQTATNSRRDFPPYADEPIQRESYGSLQKSDQITAVTWTVCRQITTHTLSCTSVTATQHVSQPLNFTLSPDLKLKEQAIKNAQAAQQDFLSHANNQILVEIIQEPQFIQPSMQQFFLNNRQNSSEVTQPCSVRKNTHSPDSISKCEFCCAVGHKVEECRKRLYYNKQCSHCYSFGHLSVRCTKFKQLLGIKFTKTTTSKNRKFSIKCARESMHFFFQKI